MEERRDFGIAVADAKRLDDCWRELSGVFAARRPNNFDDVPHFRWPETVPGNEEWVNQLNGELLAEIILDRGIMELEIPIWLRIADRDALVDAKAIKIVTHKTIQTGIYRSYERPKSFLEGHPLWIKLTDWQRFYDSVIASRYVEQGGASNKPLLDLPSDEEIRAKMHELIEAGNRRDKAAKLIRTFSGFEQVGNEHARRVVAGTLQRGRPKASR